MSNLLTNSDFSLPIITTNSFKSYVQFTAQEKIDFAWRINSDNSFTIQNGTTAYGFANASLRPVSATQYACLQLYTTIEQTKLAGIQSGAEVNVNADWNSISGDSQILNKPTIPMPSNMKV